MNFGKILEITGIDLIPYAMGFLEFTSNAPFEPTKLNEIKEKARNINANKLEKALIYSKEILDEETARGEKVETKASNLIGLTSISAAFVTGITSLISKETTNIFSSTSLTLLSIFYILIVVSLTLTILLASKAITVRNYTKPNISDVFLLENGSITELKREQLTSYMYCYLKNSQTHNIKVSYLMGAQLWFKNSVIMFLLLAFVLITILFSFSQRNTNLTLAPNNTSTIQNITSTVVITQTFPPATKTIPTQTLRPNITATLLPTITSTITNSATATISP